MKWNKILLIAVFAIFIVLASNVHALGVSPAVTDVQYKPGEKETRYIKIWNSEKKAFKAYIYVEGEMNDSIILHDSVVTFSPEEEYKKIEFDLVMPDKIEKPGTHTTKIIVMELPSEASGGGSVINSLLSVAHRLNIEVPYPGKYAEASLDISPMNSNETGKFKVEVTNLGKEPLENVYVEIEILSPTNERIDLLKTSEKSISPGQWERFIVNWVANVNSGYYHAVATVTYDKDKKIRLEKNFGVGDMLIDIVDVTTSSYEYGGVVKFDILVENKWNNLIKDVYPEVFIENSNGELVDSVKGASVDVRALSRQTLNAYWEMLGVQPGSYGGRVVINYADKKTEKKIMMEISQTMIKTQLLEPTGRVISAESKGLSIETIMIILIIVLIVINMVWFFSFRKKSKPG